MRRIALNPYLIGARGLVLLGILGLLFGGASAISAAGLFVGIGLLVELSWRNLKETREFKALIVELMSLKEESHDHRRDG